MLKLQLYRPRLTQNPPFFFLLFVPLEICMRDEDIVIFGDDACAMETISAKSGTHSNKRMLVGPLDVVVID